QGRESSPRGSAPRSQPSGDGGDDGVAETPERRERVVDRRGLVAGVHHAVTALLVAAGTAVLLPRRRLHQLLEARRIAFLEQVAWALPAEEIERRVAPRRAFEFLPAHEELQEERRLIELPPLLGILQHRAVEVVRALTAQEVLLIRRLRVAIARRHHLAFVDEVLIGVVVVE